MNEKLPTPGEWADAARAGEESREGALETAQNTNARDVSVNAELVQAIIDAARAAVPNEACGLLVGTAYAGDGGSPERYVPLRNAAESPYRYLIEPQEQLRVWLELEEAEEVPWAIVHSHVATQAIPSATDVGLAFFPDSLYVICSLAEEIPVIRGWSIRDGVITEVGLAVSVTTVQTSTKRDNVV